MIKIKLPTDSLPFLREMDSRLVSYNIEMTEVTGGTFWKLYTPGQIEGREEVPQLADLSQMGSLLEMFPPQIFRTSGLWIWPKPWGLPISGSAAPGPPPLTMILTAARMEKFRKVSTVSSPENSGTGFWIL